MHIIAGTFKGLELPVPVRGTRPTTSRTKEAIFSYLDSRRAVEDARVLDIFAGSGALGIEALSRGAFSCVFVDAGSQAVELIKKSLHAAHDMANLTRPLNVHVIRGSAQNFVNKLRSASERAQFQAEEAEKAGDDIELVKAQAALDELPKFSLVFLDPPFALPTSECDILLDTLCASGTLTHNCIITIERDKRSKDIRAPAGWLISQKRQYGDSDIFYIVRS